MKPKGSLHSELGGLASASSFPHMLLAVFVATAVGAASGAAGFILGDPKSGNTGRDANNKDNRSP